MKFQVWLLSLALLNLISCTFAEEASQVAQLSLKGGEQMLRPNPGRASTTPDVVLSPEASEIVKMSEAGIADATIQAYINHAPGFNLAAEDVIALHQRGVSLPVITAMLQHPAPNMQIARPAPTAILGSTSGPNPPIIYPTPAREAVPLTDPVVVVYSGAYAYGYGGPNVIIAGTSYYASPSYAGGACGFGSGYRNYGCDSRSYNCAPGRRCRF